MRRGKADVAALTLGFLPKGRVTSGVPLSWTQADWYVDFVNGSDSNPGTAAFPLKTVMGGLVGKWGTNAPFLPQTTTLHILTPQTLNVEQIVLEPTMLGLTSFIIVGTPQPVATGVVLGAVTAKARATNTKFSAAGFGFAGVAVGQLVHNRTAGKDSYCFIRALPGGGIANLTQPLAPMIPGTTTLFTPAPAEVDTWAIGDVVDVLTPCAINLRSVVVHGGGGSDAAFTQPALWLRYLTVLDQAGAPANSAFSPQFSGQYVTVESCFLQPTFNSLDQPNYETNLVNDYFAGGAFINQTYVTGGIVGAGFGLETEGANWLDGDFIIDLSSGLSGEVILGFVEVGNTIAGHGGAELRIEPFVYGNAIVWGVGGVINLQIESSLWLTNGVATWAASVFVPTLQLMGLAFGSGYVGGGVFNDGIAITPANLDIWQGLQNVKGGARYSSLQPTP